MESYELWFNVPEEMDYYEICFLFLFRVPLRKLLRRKYGYILQLKKAEYDKYSLAHLFKRMRFFIGFSLLSMQSMRNGKPPAMRVRVKKLYKK